MRFELFSLLTSVMKGNLAAPFFGLREIMESTFFILYLPYFSLSALRLVRLV